MGAFWSVSTRANVVGVDTQNFNPTNDGLDFVTVHSSETLKPGLINLGLFLNYAVNTLPNFEDTTTQTRTNFKDSLISADLNFAVGLASNWEVGLSAPMLLSQSVGSDIEAARGQFEQTGLTEIRAMTKWRLWGDESQGVALVASGNFNQIENNPFTGVNSGPTWNFEAAADTTMDRFALGVNLGYRFRSPGDPDPAVPIDPMRDQLIASGAISYLVPDWDTKIIAEVFASFPADDQKYISDRDLSSAEFLLGAKYDINTQAAFHVGAGTEIVHGNSSPDWRVYTGLNWVLGPLFARASESEIVKVEKYRYNDEEIRQELEEMDYLAKTPENEETFVGRGVLFAFNSDQLADEAMETLQKFADYLRKPPGLQSLVIEGHTDSVGSAEYNRSLSQRRASRVRQAMISLGIPSERVKAVGYGESQPIADNGNYQGRAMNRRVEFNVRR